MCDVNYNDLPDAIFASTDIKKKVIDTICDHFKVEFESLKEKTRRQKIVYHRQLIMYFLIENGIGCTLSAKTFDLDHATALHAVKTINNYYDIDKQVNSDVNEIRFKLAY